MARKKKDTEELELELDAELDLDEVSEEEVDEEQEEALKEPEELEEKPKAPRRRAAKKAPKAEEETVAAKPVAEEAPKTEAPIAATVSTPAPDSKDTVVLQWEAAKQASESIVGSLDKVNSMLRELPEYYSVALQKAFKNNTPRTSPAAKVAFGMSLVATVLSVLSLSFSQSARQAALTQVAVPAIEQKVETAVVTPKKKERRKAR